MAQPEGLTDVNGTWSRGGGQIKLGRMNSLKGGAMESGATGPSL